MQKSYFSVPERIVRKRPEEFGNNLCQNKYKWNTFNNKVYIQAWWQTTSNFHKIVKQILLQVGGGKSHLAYSLHLSLSLNSSKKAYSEVLRISSLDRGKKIYNSAQ